jgi:hypothetical protein
MAKEKLTPTQKLKEAEEELEALRILLAETQVAFLEFQREADIAYAQLMEFWYELPTHIIKINDALSDNDMARAFVYSGVLEQFQRGVEDYINLSEHGSKTFNKEEEHSPMELFVS